jgi:hypothetical protein
MVIIPKFKTFDHKRYKLHRAFLNKSEAEQSARSQREKGHPSRIWEKSGELHSSNRYHIYSREN